jgi:hypothetical protein
MNSKSFVKLLRKIIREEVKDAVRTVLTEEVSISNQLVEHDVTPMPSRPVAKKQFTKNSMLNDLLNETAATPASAEMTDWNTMNFRSEMADVFGMSTTGPTSPLASTGINGESINMSNPQVADTMKAMTKDYSALMKAIDKKRGK